VCNAKYDRLLLIGVMLIRMFVIGAGITGSAMAGSADLLHDAEFGSKPSEIDAARVFELSSSMRHFLEVEIASELEVKGRVRGLFDALYSQGQLKLSYDSVRTGTAAETFAEGRGNCLSLVLMTAALAKKLGLMVLYQELETDPAVLLRDGILYSSGHVNVTIGHKRQRFRSRDPFGDFLTIDFARVDPNAGAQRRPVPERTIMAMFFNNRAAEAVALGKLSEGYWWAREAMATDKHFLAAFNTLAVVYRRSGFPQHAEQVLNAILKRDPNNVAAWTNLVAVRQTLGTAQALAAASKQLNRLRPNEPYHFFKLGMRAIAEQNFALARDMFQREVRLQPGNHEFQYWLAVAYANLGARSKTIRHLTQAMKTSLTLKDQGIYAAKLAKIEALN